MPPSSCASRAAVRIRADGPTGRRRCTRSGPRAGRPGDARRQLVSAEDLPRRGLRLGVLRPIAQPDRPLVLDVGLRGTGEGALALPPPPRGRVDVRSARRYRSAGAGRAREDDRDAGCSLRWGWRSRPRSPARSPAESTIAADQSPGASLRGLDAVDRTVRVTWQGVVTPAVERRPGRCCIRRSDWAAQTEIVLMNPGASQRRRRAARGDRPAARLDDAGGRGSGAVAPGPRPRGPVAPGPVAVGSCRDASCPMLLAGGALPARTTVRRLPRRRRADAGDRNDEARSAAPLGFTPGLPRASRRCWSRGDAAGLEKLAGPQQRLADAQLARRAADRAASSWQLAATERRLQQAQKRLLAAEQLVRPLGAVRRARRAPRRRPARRRGGCCSPAAARWPRWCCSWSSRSAACAGTSTRSCDGCEAAGARTCSASAFVIAEAAVLCGVALLIGAALASGSRSLLADGAGLPAGGVLAHSLLTVRCARSRSSADGSARRRSSSCCCSQADARSPTCWRRGARGAALALALNRGATAATIRCRYCWRRCAAWPPACWSSERHRCCCREGERRRHARSGACAAGVRRARALAGGTLAGDRVHRGQHGLGGFALAYRATLLRSAADQAANQRSARRDVAAGPDFTTPLEVASPRALARRWLRTARCSPVRRTDASFVSGGSQRHRSRARRSRCGARPRLHGWRASDGSAPIATLARRLVPPGPVRAPGPLLRAGGRGCRRVKSALHRPACVTVGRRLRDARRRAIRLLALGQAGQRPQTVLARLPRGRGRSSWRAVELTEPAGLEATNGHQNGEKPRRGDAVHGTVTARPAVGDRQIRPGLEQRSHIAAWRGVGAATVGRRGAPAQRRGRDAVQRRAARRDCCARTQPSDARAGAGAGRPADGGRSPAGADGSR